MLPPLLLLAGAAAVAAQSSTVTNILMPLYSDGDIYGDVVAVDSGLTTVALHCPQKESSSFDPCKEWSATIIFGSETMSARQTMSLAEATAVYIESIDIGCVLKSGDATCTATMSQSGSTKAGDGIPATSEVKTSSESTVIPKWTESASPLTLTSGLDKLGAPAATTGPKDGSASGSGSGSGSGGAAETSTSKAGAPMVTAQAVLMGVAAALAVM